MRGEVSWTAGARTVPRGSGRQWWSWITLDDEVITGRSEDDLARMRRRHIGIVFQFFNLLEGMSVLENVALPAIVAGTKRKAAETRARANSPTLVLADEPTGALDSEGGAEVMELFRRLHAGGQSILLVTHDDDVAAAAERIVHMRDGKVVDEGSAGGGGAASGSVSAAASS